jgi:hypothetical protein
MATYLVFEPQDGARTQSNAERVVFLHEKFSPWAFILTPFWLLRYRLWLAFLIWLAVFAAITTIGGWLGYGPYAAIAASLFPSIVAGLEAINLRARKLLKSGYRDAGVVIAEDLDTAERRFFENWKNAPDKPSTPSPLPTAYPDTKAAVASAEQNIIGMFPTPGQR